MKVRDVLNCALPSWYDSFKDITQKSIIIPLPHQVLDYLHTDGVVLPQSSTHGFYTKSSNLLMDGDEDDADIRDDELMNLYEADWSVPDDDVSESQPPDLQEFDDKIKEAISSLGGRVFPKMNWSAPRDAAWISFDKTLLCTCPSDIYLLLKSSEFVTHDLDQPFSHCEDAAEGGEQRQPVVYSLVLRQWNPPAPAAEFRCFVRDQKLICACQRNIEKFYPSILQEKDAIVDDIRTFFQTHIKEKFMNHRYVFDVVRKEKAVIQLVDFNPWGIITDGLMFEWKELEDVTRWDGMESLEFRCLTSEEGVKSSSYSQYAVPLDIVDLADGENPFKLMEKMKLEAEKHGDEDSSSEEEDNNDS